jgi:hypothetical protein
LAGELGVAVLPREEVMSEATHKTAIRSLRVMGRAVLISFLKGRRRILPVE